MGVQRLLYLDQSSVIVLAITSEYVLSLIRIINIDEWMKHVETLRSLLKVCSKVICQSVRGIVHCTVSPA